MKEKIKELNKDISHLRRITFAFLPMMTIQWLGVYSVTNPITIACALFTSDIGLEQLYQHYKLEKYHANFLATLPESWRS